MHDSPSRFPTETTNQVIMSMGTISEQSTEGPRCTAPTSFSLLWQWLDYCAVHLGVTLTVCGGAGELKAAQLWRNTDHVNVHLCDTADIRGKIKIFPGERWCWCHATPPTQRSMGPITAKLALHSNYTHFQIQGMMGWIKILEIYKGEAGT